MAGSAAHHLTGPVSLEGAGHLRAEEMALRHLRVELAGGWIELAGAYQPEADSLEADLTWEDLQLSAVPGSEVAGSLEGAVHAAGRPGLRQYEVAVAATARGLDALPGELLDVEVQASLRPDGAATAAVRSAAGAVEARGVIDLAGTYDLVLSGRLRPAVLVGQPMGEVALSGRLVPDTLSLRLETARLPAGLAGLSPARLALRLTTWQRLEADLSVAGREGIVQASLDLAAARLDTASLVATALDLSRLDALLSGRVSGRAQARGALSPLDLGGTARLRFADLAVAGWQLGPAVVRLSYANRVLKAGIEGEGIAAAATLDAALVLDGRADLTEVVARWPGTEAGDAEARVTVSGQARARGPLSRLERMEVALELSRLELHQGAWEVSAAAPVSASYREGRGQLEPVVLETTLGTARVEGRTWGDSLSLEAHLDSLRLTPLHPELSGAGALSLVAGGRTEAPTVVADLRTGPLHLGGQPLGAVRAHLTLADALELRADLCQGAARPEGVGAPAAADSSLTLRLTAPLAAWRGQPGQPGARGELSMEARQVQVGPLVRWALGDSVDGLLDGACSLAFAAPEPGEAVDWSSLAGQVTLRRARLEKQGFRASLQREATADFRGAEVQVSDVVVPLAIYRRDRNRFEPAGTVTARGRLGADASQELTVRLDSINLVAVERLPGVRDLALPDGSLSAQGALTGTPEARRYELSSLIRFDDLGQVTAAAAGSGTGVEAHIRWDTPAGDSLTAAIAVPAAPLSGDLDWEHGSLHLHSDGLDAGVFLELLPQLESLGGSLRADLEVSGLGQQTEVSGQIEVERPFLALLDTKPEYALPSGVIRFAGSRGQLEGFEGAAQNGKGRIALTGYVELASLSDLRYRVGLEVEDLPYRYDTVFEAPDVDAKVAFSYAGDEALLEGEVRITGAVAEAPLVELAAAPIPPPPAVQDPFLEATRLNVFLEVRQLAVRNELTDLTIEGSTRAYGTFYKPRFQGEMQIVRGTVLVLNREFTFTKGTIALDQLVPTYSILDLAYDPLLLNPELDLAATTRLKPIDEDDYREVTMTIQGPARQVAPRFSSEGLGDTEVITLLAFGSTTPTNYTDALYTTAGQLVLSRGATRVGLDEFQLLPRGTVLSTADGTALRLGKHLTFPFPLWVRYEGLARDPAIGQLRLEYDVTSYLKLKGTAQSQYQVYGLGVGFRKDF
ncbi:MAG: translocation/assembly module TamB domain-containing protein [Gemmatimonadota bacterium]